MSWSWSSEGCGGVPRRLRCAFTHAVNATSSCCPRASASHISMVTQMLLLRVSMCAPLPACICAAEVVLDTQEQTPPAPLHPLSAFSPQAPICPTLTKFECKDLLRQLLHELRYCVAVNANHQVAVNKQTVCACVRACVRAMVSAVRVCVRESICSCNLWLRCIHMQPKAQTGKQGGQDKGGGRPIQLSIAC